MGVTVGTRAYKAGRSLQTSPSTAARNATESYSFLWRRILLMFLFLVPGTVWTLFPLPGVSSLVPFALLTLKDLPRPFVITPKGSASHS